MPAKIIRELELAWPTLWTSKKLGRLTRISEVHPPELKTKGSKCNPCTEKEMGGGWKWEYELWGFSMSSLCFFAVTSSFLTLLFLALKRELLNSSCHCCWLAFWWITGSINICQEMKARGSFRSASSVQEKTGNLEIIGVSQIFRALTGKRSVVQHTLWLGWIVLTRQSRV